MTRRTGASRTQGQAGPTRRGAKADRTSATAGGGARARLHALFPALSEAYEAMARSARDGGPLDARSVALVKVALSVGRGSWRGTHAHARKALEAGVTPAELRHVAATALPTLGLAASLDAMRWIEEIIDERGLGTRSR